MVTEQRMRLTVITTRDRPDAFTACLAAIRPQVDWTVVVDHTGNDYVAALGDGPLRGMVTPVAYEDDPPNISTMWNLGLEEADRIAGGRPYDVAVLNDDVIVPPGWFARIVDAMRRTGAVAGCADQHGRRRPVVQREAGPVDLRDRMTGFAFILDGSAGLRADERLCWWYGDDMLDWQARERGGMVVVPGVPVDHLHPGSTTVGALAEQAGVDRETFIDIWGRAPW